ncbi:pyridoxal phosphate-dependent transferase [Spinellus fusiger]|nr:pyridoxal phosphate-dependent transferase [Spinellus fusiger]
MFQRLFSQRSVRLSRFFHSSSLVMSRGLEPSSRVAHFERDVWSIFSPLAIETNAINLGQGFMNFGPEPFVQEAANAALKDPDANQYSHPRGRIRLRKALADSYSKELGRALDPESEIVVTAGANEGIFVIFASFLNEGDEVICMEPFFDQYIPNITMNGGVPTYVPLRTPSYASERNISAREWRLDINELRSKITPKTKFIVLNTPHNPIGKVFTEEELIAIGDVAEEHDLIILSDEVYDRLFFPPYTHLPRIASLKNFWNRTLTVGSGGKTFAATGWRVGWIIGPENLLNHCLAAQTRIIFCVNSPCQEAVAAGFEESLKGDYFQKQIDDYSSRYAILSEGFDKLGLPYTVPEGAYFILANTSKIQYPKDYPFPAILDNRGEDFKICYWLTKEIGVCAIPPSEFYEPAHRDMAKYLARFAFCKTEDVLHEAVKRLQALIPYIKN